MGLEQLAFLINYLSTFASLIGTLLLAYGVLITTLRTLRAELFGESRFHQNENNKRVFIQKIILALDFFVAADLLRLAVVSGWSELTNAALVVAIRTVLSWSLSREVHLHKE